MSSWIPNDYSHRAQLASVIPSDIKTFSQLMNDVKYADVDGDGSTHGTGNGQDSGNDKKQLALRTQNLCNDWCKKHPGASKDDFEKNTRSRRFEVWRKWRFVARSAKRFVLIYRRTSRGPQRRPCVNGICIADVARMRDNARQ